MTRPKTLVTFSGGMDSTTLVYYLRDQGHDVTALSVDYGQRHRIELKCAAHLLQLLGIHHKIADLKGITQLLGSSSLTDPNIQVPHGHYAAENMKSTVVPNRNMLLLATATAVAISERADYIAYAAHAGDHTIYPDCRPEFAEAMANAISLCDWHHLELIRPFINKSKAEIARLGQSLGVPYELTWSCYEGKDLHCGACGTCVERREAFLLANVSDPTHYVQSAPLLTLGTDGKALVDWSRTIDCKKRVVHERDPIEQSA